MVRERAREVYSGIKAPESLRESIKASIKVRRIRMAKQSAAWLSAAACLMLVVLNGMPDGNAPVIRVGGEHVSEQALGLDAYVEEAGIPAVSRARSMPGAEKRLRIPLEIRVSQTAHVSVSVGTLLESVETASEADSCTELDISGNCVVYWLTEGTGEESAVCTITTEKGIFRYVLEFDESSAVYTIKQMTETR